MTHSTIQRIAALSALAAMLQPTSLLRAQQPTSAPNANASIATSTQTPTGDAAPSKLAVIRVKSELVLVSVLARDKSGRPVRDLKASDFALTEDGRPQTIRSFDVQNAEGLAEQSKDAPQQAAFDGANSPLTAARVDAQKLRDRRLIVLFFDLSSMQSDELERALEQASQFVHKKMTAADLVAVVSFQTSVAIAQDFTNDRKALDEALLKLAGEDDRGFANGDDGGSDTADAGQSYDVDDSEYNIFNSDRRLQALTALSQTLARVDQKKSVLYFSSGMTQTGLDNQAQLRAAVNAAVRGNVSLYPVDARGLEATPGGGAASSGSQRGQGAYTGAMAAGAMDKNFASQETLVTLASDTGGKAFLDANDFSPAFERVLDDNSYYYVLGYRSANGSLDGRYRRIGVKVNRPDVRLEFRRGYYGPRDFKHYAKDDREQQLIDELASDMPSTDLPVYVAANHFRMKDEKCFVHLSILVPGSAIPFVSAGDKDRASLDFIGVVREKMTHLPVGQLRETVKLDLASSRQARASNVQYRTGFLLPPGSYVLKLAVRENANGAMGGFEQEIVVPDLKKPSRQLRLSSVVLAGQKTSLKQTRKLDNPLAVGDGELIPSLSHVFLDSQPIYIYYEVYDPSADKSQKNGVRLLTSVSLFRGRVKAYETPLTQATSMNLPERRAQGFQLELPAGSLKPGWYTAQINVIDDAGGLFAFPRLPILVKPTPAPPTNSGTSAADKP